MLTRTFGCVRVVWNRTLTARRERYATERRRMSYGETGTAHKRGLNRSIAQTGWAEMRRMLEYKAERSGRRLLLVDRWSPSSKTCSACGYLLDELRLGTRTWACPDCGTRHDRDVNAAKNILAAGLAVARQCDACGDGVRHTGATSVQPSVKQEPLVARPELLVQ
jgi:putative transposase